MRLCTSDVTPVITRPGLETGRCQMVATVAADTISPALLYNSRASPIRRALYLYESPPTSAGRCGWRLRRAHGRAAGACHFRSTVRSLYNCRYRRATNAASRVWVCLSVGALYVRRYLDLGRVDPAQTKPTHSHLHLPPLRVEGSRRRRVRM